MGMKIEIAERRKVSPEELDQMYAVFSRYYANANRSRFESDLEKKDWVIQLRNHQGWLVGFSTLQLYRHSGELDAVMVLYSGDTIIDRAYRRDGSLAGAFGHILLRCIEDFPNLPIYWLLTSKGPRTYRFLPVFFRNFYPAYNHKMPEGTGKLLDEIAFQKFGTHYCPESQVVSHGGERDRLADPNQDSRLLARDDPHIRFFVDRNPGYVGGDELVCLAEISKRNLNSRANRVIRYAEVEWRE